MIKDGQVHIAIDFETRSRIDLKKCGLTKYAKDGSTDVICMGWNFLSMNNPTSIWTPYKTVPPPFLAHKRIKYYAWNAAFELAIWNNVLAKKYMYPPLDMNHIVDVQAMALYAGLPASLEACGQELLGVGKDLKGKMLINKLSKPMKNGHFRKYPQNSQLFQDMYQYCKRDVGLTIRIYEEIIARFPQMSAVEWAVWRQTNLMNIRGVPIDETELHACCRLIESEKHRENSKTPIITDGEVQSVTQIAKLKQWLKSKGTHAPSLNKSSIENLLKDDEAKPEIKEVLRIRQRVGLSTNAKYFRACEMVQAGRIHDTHFYYGAHTGRESGRGVQFQNLKRFKVSEFDADFFMTAVVNDDVDMLRMIYGSDLLIEFSHMIRSLIKASPGKKFICADYSSIEAVATPWLAGEQDLLKDIRSGLDQYKRIASRMFSVAYDEVTDIQRQIGKIVILACGYAGGAKALVGMAQNYGLYPDVIDQIKAQFYVQLFRKARPKLCLSWRMLGEAAYRAVSNPGKMIFANLGGEKDIVFCYKSDVLQMFLPSGRPLCYHQPRLSVEIPWNHSLNVVIRGKEAVFSGANLFQNAVQAICRDLLMHARLNLEKAGYPIIMAVHDECMAEVDDDPRYNLQEFINVMTDKPMWAGDMPVKADGWEGKRYRK